MAIVENLTIYFSKESRFWAFGNTFKFGFQVQMAIKDAGSNCLICYVIYRWCCLAVSVQRGEKAVSGLLHSQVHPPAAVQFSLS